LYFLIDGYNLLFSWLEDQKGAIEKKRVRLVQWIQHEFKRFNLCGIIVFDGAHRREEESGLSYPSPMEVAFTPKGQTADENILERIESFKNRKDITIVTNDLGLKRQASVLGAKILSNDAFLEWLQKRAAKKKSKRTPTKDSPKKIERLLKIFEERLNRELED
jgi:predicted RNA-binding protein with PIN domain